MTSRESHCDRDGIDVKTVSGKSHTRRPGNVAVDFHGTHNFSRHPPVTHYVEENRRRKADGIHAVEHATVAFDHRAPILDATIALDGRQHEAAEKSHDVDGERDQAGLPRIERRDSP